MTETLKVAVVTPIPTPYRDPFWNVLAQRPDIDLTVFYCAAGKSDRPWAANWTMTYRNEVLAGHNLSPRKRAGESLYWNPDIRKRLRSVRYDAVVVGGYNHLTLLAAMREARLQRIPYFLMNESRLDAARSAWRRRLKEVPVRKVMRGAWGGFPTGKGASDYLAYYGIPPERQALVPNAPDVVELRARASVLRQQREELRANLGIPPGAPTAVFVGRLIRKKGCHELLGALAQPAAPSDMHLVVVGDGVERGALERQAASTGLGKRVHFVGFAAPTEVPKYYAMADLFALPSSETWGVVVLEALASGLPVLVSDQVGCHPDVVISPAVGTVLPKGDAAAWATALSDWSRSALSADATDVAWAPVYEALHYPMIAERMATILYRGARTDR